jgi:CRISPR-associated protein Cmr6
MTMSKHNCSKPKSKKKPQNQLEHKSQNKSQDNQDADCVPLMFQAQIPERGKIQYAGTVEPASKWVNQWLQCCPPAPEVVDDNLPIWKRQSVRTTVKLPQFGENVETRSYKIRWRLVTNSGQDEGVIRPVIGAKGLPFFPGSSMKGAFLRACATDAERLRYCGGEQVTHKGEKKTVPGILRFHGGYPVDMTWANRDRLIDVVHSQQSYQVMYNRDSPTANVQISLYQAKLKFGISAIKPFSKAEWNYIWQIWEKAIAQGLGSRVSAGYGCFDKVHQDDSITLIEIPDRVIISVDLTGKGLAPQLLNKTGEFRPNMFKAALRGHTLRLLSGITNETVTKALTQKIWGGIDGGATIGQVGIAFTVEDKECLDLGEHTFKAKKKLVLMPTYDLEIGTLKLLQVSEISSELKQFLQYLLRFSLLLGGFGKSWRRIHHKEFHPSYFKRDDKPMIGCHWEILEESQSLWVLNNESNLSGVTRFLKKVQDSAIAWLRAEGYEPNGYIENWRESWHPGKVEVWGRIAKNKHDSHAVKWFHGNYKNLQSIKNSELTGWAAKKDMCSQVSRIWHRMYPRYVKNKSGKLIRLKNDEYIELLTIFPDDSEETKEFLDFLADDTEFQQLWGD